MSEITLHVGGRGYTVSCADGEEDHVRHLASVIDGKIAALSGNRAPGDARNLLFAALILADEVEEARGERAEPEREGLPQSEFDLAAADRLESIADRLENLWQSLREQAAGSK